MLPVIEAALPLIFPTTPGPGTVVAEMLPPVAAMLAPGATDSDPPIVRALLFCPPAICPKL